MESQWKTTFSLWKTCGKTVRCGEGEFELPLFDLGPPPEYHLKNAPLAQAVVQVRYPLIASLETLQGIAGLQSALEHDFPYMEQQRVAERSFVLGPDGPSSQQTAESIRWHFTNDNDQLIVVGAGSATLSEGTSYQNVGVFREALETMLQALKLVGVQRCDRVGVRYLSLAEELPGAQHSWRNWFRDELLGWVGLTFVGNELQTSLNQVRLVSAAPPAMASGPSAHIHADVRHGALPKGTQVPGIPPIEVSTASYLLELDVSFASQQTFDVEPLVAQFDALHSEIDSFFYWCLTTEGGEHFGLEVRDS